MMGEKVKKSEESEREGGCAEYTTRTVLQKLQPT